MVSFSIFQGCIDLRHLSCYIPHNCFLLDCIHLVIPLFILGAVLCIMRSWTCPALYTLSYLIIFRYLFGSGSCITLLRIILEIISLITSFLKIYVVEIFVRLKISPSLLKCVSIFIFQTGYHFSSIFILAVTKNFLPRHLFKSPWVVIFNYVLEDRRQAAQKSLDFGLFINQIRYVSQQA